MFLGLSTFTWIHTLLSIVALISGVVVLRALFTSRVPALWTEVYWASITATCITGFGFDIPFGPAHVVGIITLVLTAAALLAHYVLHLAGAWRWIYSASVVLTVYFNFFVLVVQLFRKVPALHALAPTESEPPFAVAQTVLLLVFAWLLYATTRKFHPETAPAPAGA
jgi:hypothetical protein